MKPLDLTNNVPDPGLQHGARYPTPGNKRHSDWYAQEHHTFPCSNGFVQLWRSLNQASRDKLYAEADEIGRKVYDDLNKEFPV